MMTGTKEVLKSLMKEANLNPKIQQELLFCAESGKSFPHVPRSLTEIKCKVQEPIFPQNPKFPARPIQRPKSTIEKLGDYERDRFRPNPSKTRPPHEKQRLQNLMAYGKDIEEDLRNLCIRNDPVEQKDTSVDLFAEILNEIMDRKEFLDDMTELGEAKKYLPEIQCQIALRLRELEKLDKARAQEIIQKYRM